MSENVINVKVEYESRQVRHLAVQCPECNNWFRSSDIADDFVHDEFDIYQTKYICPLCGNEFGTGFSVFDDEDVYNYQVEEVDYPEIYNDCRKKRVLWE